MNNISICVICRKSKALTDQLTVIRSISGIKVLKRRNKPFYDITGSIAADSDLATMRQTLEYLLNHGGAQIEIQDDELRQVFFEMLK